MFESQEVSKFVTDGFDDLIFGHQSPSRHSVCYIYFRRDVAYGHTAANLDASFPRDVTGDESSCDSNVILERNRDIRVLRPIDDLKRRARCDFVPQTDGLFSPLNQLFSALCFNSFDAKGDSDHFWRCRGRSPGGCLRGTAERDLDN